MLPLITVIIPTYNRAQRVPIAIRSALAQTYPAVEVVVVNDGSTDETAEVLDTFGTQIVAVHQANRGLGAARNAGLAQANGDYVLFLDDDDWLTPEAIAKKYDL